ncbi:two-component system sensor histidine kinase KdpD [Thermosporothrix hazakensis]|jgi:two-component system sensor histidine kinase KdpD|uniref:Two-component system sensor histidine kinase KdpD n=2 Tax=Thermosporothrix TaxID=768650 RepID=A0A326UAK0_THEHA|nr:universal stress protein [Thermosporothrix hazakensis]PZW31960.1 two-component system sensor histidine kinase KdpD [Thermosporothrix hazakensis]BBH91569.1 hypothetical protein KTC_63200 [Thermosporothrix sp. COM3]GCE49715.1 hypothetical protein KTH_45840 [Thermosporothrix hazakensis]
MTDLPPEFQREDGRPDPEALLKRYHLDEEEQVSTEIGQTRRRGRLRVYLGAAAGVGKTYAMLNEGRRRKERGTDVVIGYVETHKRSQTEAQIGDLEIIPRKQILYKGVLLEEMDTDAILKRYPEVALVDELAHTNAAGSKHKKRYQDVLEILEAGIDVIATLNVQHLESLNDLVSNITGITVRETLPDWVLDQADEVELIDIAPRALRQRMRHGNIYPPERIETALNNFFREGNLTALREIALRLTANKTESQLQQYLDEHAMQATTWETNERVLVGFDHRPQSRSIIRDAWRLAHGLHADFVAVSIEVGGYRAFLRRLFALVKYRGAIKAHRAEARKRLEEHMTLAEDLGAEVLRIKGDDVAALLAEIARQKRATQIVVGQPAHTRFEEMLYGSVINRLLRLNPDVDIHIVPLKREEGPDL